MTPNASADLVRYRAIVAACGISTVKVLTPVPPALTAALSSTPGVTIVDSEDADVAVAVSADGEPLDAATIDELLELARRGARVIVDSVAVDPAFGRFAAGDGPVSRALLFAGDATDVTALEPHQHEPGAQRVIDALVRENRLLATARIGVHDAAASRAAAAGSELRAARAQYQERVAHLEEQLASAVASAKQNDELFQQARTDLLAATTRSLQLERVVGAHQVHLGGWLRWRVARVLRVLGRRG